ncbi:apolipoprotein N-acyltransferase [Marinospirillum perlucidum]|uniref:apolipoprotein N-acyltransferase n=1 Tax=Marinospirillum perlucidum TaxID=1982602 RepID=UPI001FEB7EBE|nr:apolipoprotein N-acyltransferase [Marinospirillum perlucidum]
MFRRLTARFERSLLLRALGSLAAGSLITLAMAPFNAWPLALLAPVALLLILRPLKPLAALIQGWFFGVGVYGSGASWVYVSIQVHGGTPVPLAFFLTLLFIASLALFFALHAWLWQQFLASRRLWLLNWTALWVLMEAFRSWFLTGFPWLLLGTAHLESPLAGWAPLVGVYGVGAISLLAGLLLVWALRPGWFNCKNAKEYGWQAKQTLALVGSLALLSSGYLLQPIQWTQPVGDPLRAALVQGNVAQQNKWDPSYQERIIRDYLQLSQQAGEVDLIIWPETAIPLSPGQAQPFLDLALQGASSEAALITGLVTPLPERRAYYNSLVTAGQASGDYHKVQLVPFGEYLPLEEALRGLISFFNLPMSSFVSGPANQAPLEAQGTRVAPLICYEITYPDFTARQAATSNWLLTVSNDSWFGRSIGPLQHFQIARFRALETGRELVRVTNNGITALVDHQGQIKQRLPQFTQEVLLGAIQPREGSTPFMQTTSWPLWLACLLLLAWQTRPPSRSRI